MKTLVLLLLTQFGCVDSLVHQAISDSLIPGAVVCYVEADTIAFLKAYGNKAVYPQEEKMTVNTIFDLASVSKSTGAGTVAMNLIRAGRLSADDKVNRYLPAFEGDATIRHLLTHTSGLPSYMTATILDSIYQVRGINRGMTRPQFLMDTICRCKRLSAPGETYRYSCLNFITLQNVVQTITRTPLDRLRPYYRPITDPMDSVVRQIAPTEVQPDGSVLRGQVHDPLARIMNEGISGNAGIFMTASQLSEWCVWFMSIPQEQREQACNCGLWIDDDGTLGHTGYTGTSIRLDPATHRAVIILTNRVHPVDKGNLRDLRHGVEGALLGGKYL